MRFRYRREEEMKDGGVEWIEKIPEAWELLMFKRIIESVKNGIWGDEPKKDINDIPCIRILNFNRSKMEVDIDDLTTRNIPILKQREYLLNKGDLLIEKSGGGEKQPVGFVARYNHELPAVYANFMAKISLNNELAISAYIKYLCATIYNKRLHLDSVNQTTGIQNLDSETYFKRIIAIPNIEEQDRIARFLDKKTAQFDTIISKKEALIQTLEEAKKSLISEVVTGKVKVVKTSDGYMLAEISQEEIRDSGVEWIGKIPIKWEAKRIKYLLTEISERSIDGLEEPLSMSQKYGLIRTSEMDNIPNQALSLVGNKICYEDDLVFNKLKAHLGVFSVSSQKGIVSPDYAVYRSKGNVNIKYLEYLFKTRLYILQFKKYSTGVGEGLTRLYTSGLFNITAIVPPLDEQNLIVNYINRKIEEMNVTINKTQLQIQKLKEAKQALISEAVTGKIEILD